MPVMLLFAPALQRVDLLAVQIHPSPAALARAAAHAAASYLSEVIAMRGEARVVFGSAPSQDRFFAALVDPEVCGIALDWGRVTAFHMDDYLGLPASHPQSFRAYLQHHFLNHVEVKTFHPIPADEPNSEAVCARYAARLSEKPIDLICLGIGENGHIAFNDPPIADFDDPKLVKVIALDPVCRQQQVNDGCFARLAEVPEHAITITIPVFRQGRRLTVQVPGERKAAAVRATLHDPISPACPATILRTHPAATLYLEPASASRL